MHLMIDMFAVDEASTCGEFPLTDEESTIKLTKEDDIDMFEILKKVCTKLMGIAVFISSVCLHHYYYLSIHTVL